MLKRMLLLLTTVLLTTGTMLYAGGQQEAAGTGDDIVLRYAPMYGATLTEDLYRTLIERFEAENPNVKIDLVLQPSAGVMHRDFLKTLQATGQFPDIMSMASPGDFVDSGLLMPLPMEKMDYLKNRETQIIGGKNYVAVYKTMVGGFWYNKDIFASLDLTAPQNYGELLEVCEAIKASGTTPISMGVKDGWPQLVLASTILSADILSQNPDWGVMRNDDKVRFTDPDFKRAIAKYEELVQNYAGDALESITYEQMRQQFYTGKAAMLPMGSWVVGEIDSLGLDFAPGFFPVPGDDSADTVSVWQNEGLSISANTRHPEVCLDFIKFYMTDPVWYSAFLQTESLFSNSTADIGYPMSDFRKELGEQAEKLRGIEHWYDMTGDGALLPGLQSYFNKMTAKIATGADADQELKRYDSEWDLAKSNLQ